MYDDTFPMFELTSKKPYRAEPQEHHLLIDYPKAELLSPETHSALQYFRVSLPMVTQYVLSNWDHLMVNRDDQIYEMLANTIESGDTIFSPLPSFDELSTTGITGDQYHKNFEYLYSLVMSIFDAFKPGLRGALNPNDESDLTTLSPGRELCDALVVTVTPQYSKS
jgi:hypothetical protein